MELCKSCWEALILMGVTLLLSLSRQIKNKRPILSLEIRPCCGIKDWGILEKRVFEHYTIKVWLTVEGMSNCNLDFDFCEHCIYGKQN